ncbi:MAG: SLC13 family permease [[Eubacterium] siraeum]|nr:SLC13 family permease [[Eubacterium] siraeum]
MQKVLKIFKAQPVLIISFLAAVISLFFIPPDKEYLNYIDYRTLILLFCLMLTVAGFRKIGIFESVTSALLKKAKNVRRLGLIFALSCFFSSMIVTNDVALITFVPLTLAAYTHTRDEKSKILTVVIETVAANLGSMGTPIGNPQNLFIYTKYELNLIDFWLITLPFAAFSLGAVILMTLFLPKKEFEPQNNKAEAIPKKKAVFFLLMLILCILTVFKLIPLWICFILTVAAGLILDKSLFLKVDYALLGTFAFFFVFVGNIARIESINSFISGILPDNELLICAVLSQAVSNMPAAVMLAGFTENARGLLLGADIGGMGTVIASMASLISFQIYRRSEGANSKKYMGIFSAVNFSMLILLLLFALVIGANG